jgi:arylsulfatase A-like enzyme
MIGNKPNVVFVFGDQWRQQATGYAGDPNVATPNLDALARESINFTHAVSGCPVCSPYRASLLTGQRPLTHGVFVNDVYLQPRATSIAEAFSSAGYDTAYIGKWHVDGHGRSNYIPPERRLGFDYWKVLECTHAYNHSPYYAGDSDGQRIWNGYDAAEQTHDARNYIANRDKSKPFLLMVSWGPPHNPYETAPEAFRKLYDPKTLTLRPNVPAELDAKAREWLAGYYAHCSALDACVGELLASLREQGIEQETVFVFTSDHGDMLGSQGETRKQRPWDEAIRVPFLLRYPGLPAWRPRETEALIDAPDIMPTLLGLCGIPIPETVEGTDFAPHIQGREPPADDAALIQCAHAFGEWTTARGGKEYRGLRTRRYTYVRDLNGPWLLYDNEADPYQMQNLVDDASSADVRNRLDETLRRKLVETDDQFLPGPEYIRKWGYTVDANGTVPYKS